MREYLIWFFERFDYPPEAVLALFSTYDKIKGEPLFLKWLSVYDKTIDLNAALADMETIAKNYDLHRYTVEFVLCAALSRRAKELYLERGYGEERFLNTFADLRYKLMECYALYGVWGTFVGWWFYGHLHLTLFGLGRLQFEIVPLKYPYKQFVTGAKVLNMHIPSSGPLIHSDCLDSYRMAADFFKGELGGSPVFVCDSWLLYPAHYDFLSSSSNILSFMNDFDIVYSKEDSEYHNMWRVFGRNFDGDTESLPEDTGLRRAYKTWLRDGNLPGEGYGVFLYDKNKESKSY